jgi:hypothetical protein
MSMIHTNRRFNRFLTVPAATLLMAACLAADEFVVSRDGYPACDIVLAEDASAPERTAARELVLYLGKATGAGYLTLTPEQRGERPVIAVGPGAARALAPELDLTKDGPDGLGEDGIVLKTVGENLILTGAEGSKRGTLYAVYDLLERAVGVRWWTPTEEFVPEAPNLVISPQHIRYVPPFLYREVFGWGMVPKERQWGYDDSDEAAVDWTQHRFAARMRNNGHGTSMPASLGGCIVPLGWCHTFFRFIPPAKYFDQHPEWFSLVNGIRTHRHAQLCMTNDEMLKELTDNVMKAVREHPDLGMVVVTQGDWRGHCECEHCRAIDEAEGTPMGSILHGINRVAEAVEKEFPDFLVATHAYMYSVKPPKTMRPRDNVAIWYCLHRTVTQPIDSEANRKVFEELQAWSKVAPKLIAWDYMTNFKGPFTLFPNLHTCGEDFRTLLENHVVGVFAESEAVTLSDNVDAKMYVMSKLLWDPSQDEQALIDAFMQGYYGAAAPHLQEWRGLLRAESADVTLYVNHGDAASWLDLEAMNRSTELFEKAQAAVAGDAVLAGRVRRARFALDHQWLYDYQRYRQEAESSGLPFKGPQDPAVFADELLAFAQAALKPYKDWSLVRQLPRFMGAHPYEKLRRLKLRATTPPGPLPAHFDGVARERVLEIDEFRAFIHYTAQLVEDPKASNGLAMRVPRSHTPSWAVQAWPRAEQFGKFGRYRVYAVVRCDIEAESGQAFVAGVWHRVDRKGIGAVSFPIGKAGPPATAAEIDANPVMRYDSIRSGTSVTDGEYHLYDFGSYDIDEHTSVWVGTTTGDLYVDRFLFVREASDDGQ